MPDVTNAGRRQPYVAPSIRDYGDLVEVTASIGGTLSDVPRGTPTGAGCTNVSNCFS
jgi:hypothetical protein